MITNSGFLFFYFSSLRGWSHQKLECLVPFFCHSFGYCADWCKRIRRWYLAFVIHSNWYLAFVSTETVDVVGKAALTYLYITFQITQGDLLSVKVNKLTSTKTQLPYTYYSLPYCRPDQIVDSAENLGEVLRGDRIENSLFEASWISHMIWLLSFFLKIVLRG